jgi:anti-sigma factor RsiW
MPRNPNQHLTEEEFVGFVLEDLPDELAASVEAHLERCEACARQLEEFYQAQEHFPEQEWAAQRDSYLAELDERILGSPVLVARWEHVGLAAAAASRSIQDGQIETTDGPLRWRRVEDAEGNLTARFGSHALALKGREIRVRVGEYEQRVKMVPKARDQVGAEILIPSAERAHWPADAVLVIELLPEGGDGTTEKPTA